MATQLSSTARIMVSLTSSKKEAFVEGLKTKANNSLATLSVEALDQNNFAIKDRLSRLAQASPDLYRSYGEQIAKFESRANNAKKDKDAFTEDYQSLSKIADDLKKDPTPAKLSEFKNKVNSFITNIIEKHRVKTQIEEDQLKLFDNIFVTATQAGISLPAEKRKPGLT
jgi:uncharacterized protein YaaR (DUF327 family)